MGRRIEAGPARAGGGRLFRPGEDRPLPWLEPEEDEEDDDEPGFDPRRALVLVLGGVALLGALGGGAYWLLNRHEDNAIVPDGSLIDAPDAPYKVRPADPGGTQVTGTGDESFKVGEGLDNEGRIAGESASLPDDAPGAAAGGVGVQIGAYPSADEARAGWVFLSDRIPALQGRGHRILEGSADAGTVFRLQAVAGSADDAEALCQAIRTEGGDCQVKN